MNIPPEPVLLVILDGFGLAESGPGNAVALADTPVFDRIWAGAPHTRLHASGLEVGLPQGQIGNSEVGHLNIGAGRVVMQSLTFIDEQIRTGAFFANQVLLDAMHAARGGTLHLMGLVSHGGVHSSIQHLLALLELADRQQVERVAVHVFTDGRDTAPDSGLPAMLELQAKLLELRGHAFVASVCGRYFAMDRDRRWERTREAYSAVVCGQADNTATSGANAVQDAYMRGETDEFIRPTVIVGADGRPLAQVEDGDSVLFFNFRADRARQLTHAFTGQDHWDGFSRCRVPRVTFTTMMEYEAGLNLPFAFSLPELKEPLAEVISRADLSQFHAAETEKYAHVTYFFNAFAEDPYSLEERRLVPSPKVATYDLQPEMSSVALTDSVVERLEQGADSFVLVNYANPDMVGHTGSLPAAIRACEATDRGLGRLLEAVDRRGGCALVIADHGNAEQMLEADGVSPHTAHTTNPVPCVLVGGPPGVSLRDGGRLADVAPTVLELLGLPQPVVMTGRSLLIRS